MTKPEIWALPTEYSSAAVASMNEAVSTISRELHPILSSVQRESVADLPRPEEHSSETAELASPLDRSFKASHVSTADVKDALDGNVNSYLTIVFNAADAFGSQLTEGIMEHIREVSDAFGQTIETNGRDFFDALIEAYETLEIEFDENGETNLTLAVNPETERQLRGKRPTPAQQSKIDEIIERKREEWNASRRRHELP